MSKTRGKLRVAAYLILQQEDKILLLQRRNTGYQDGKYSFVAGHVEHDETPRGAILREAFEEAGLTIQPDDLRFIQVVHRACEDDVVYIDYFFVASRWCGEVRNREPDKCGGLDWFPVAALPGNTIPYIKDVVEKWQRGVVLNEFGWEDS